MKCGNISGLALEPEHRRWILIPEQRQQLDTFAALAAIDAALELPDDGCNSLAQTLAAIRALKKPLTEAQIEDLSRERRLFRL